MNSFSEAGVNNSRQITSIGFQFFSKITCRIIGVFILLLKYYDIHDLVIQFIRQFRTNHSSISSILNFALPDVVRFLQEIVPVPASEVLYLSSVLFLIKRFNFYILYKNGRSFEIYS